MPVVVSESSLPQLCDGDPVQQFLLVGVLRFLLVHAVFNNSIAELRAHSLLSFYGTHTPPAVTVRVVVDLTAVLLVGDHLVEGLCVFNAVQTCPPRVCGHHTCDFEAVLVAN